MDIKTCRAVHKQRNTVQRIEVVPMVPCYDVGIFLRRSQSCRRRHWRLTKTPRQLHSGSKQPRIGTEHWAIRSFVRSFACTAHTFACSAQLALFAHSAVLIRSLAHSLIHFRACWKVNDSMSQINLVLPHSVLQCAGTCCQITVIKTKSEPCFLRQ